MARAMWKGSITFGLVTIPVALHNATRSEEIRFRMLRKGDMSPIRYKRVAEVDEKEVPWEDIVKGYEYEKGRFITMTDEDFDRVPVESTDTIGIIDFVDVAEINPIYFETPYYIEPQKGGAAAYALLRDVLAKTNKAGIAKITMKTREHLAAVKANDNMLVLELMHFADELVPADEFKVPEAKELGKREEQMAMMLVDQMTDHWDPTRYKDEYKTALMKLIEQKVESGGKELPVEKTQRRSPTNVIDLVSVLQKSLQEAGRGGKQSVGHGQAHPPAAHGRRKTATKKRAAHHHHKKAA